MKGLDTLARFFAIRQGGNFNYFFVCLLHDKALRTWGLL